MWAVFFFELTFLWNIRHILEIIDVSVHCSVINLLLCFDINSTKCQTFVSHHVSSSHLCLILNCQTFVSHHCTFFRKPLLCFFYCMINYNYNRSRNEEITQERVIRLRTYNVVLESAGYLVHSFLKKEKRQQRLLQAPIFECLKTLSYLSFADEESIGHQCGFNKMGPLLIQRERP